MDVISLVGQIHIYPTRNFVNFGNGRYTIISLVFDLEDGGGTYLQNIGSQLQVHAVLLRRRPQSTISRPWEPEISAAKMMYGKKMLEKFYKTTFVQNINKESKKWIRGNEDATKESERETQVIQEHHGDNANPW